MFLTYQNPVYTYLKSPDQAATEAVHHPLVVVGAGPVGMAAAIDAAMRGIEVLVLDEDNTVSVGSRAVCYSKRALEILDRLGCARDVVAPDGHLERAVHAVHLDRDRLAGIELVDEEVR